MKFKELRIWLYVFGLSALVAIYLYQQSNTHRRQLEAQAVKAVALGKNNVSEALTNYHQQLDEYLVRNLIAISKAPKAKEAISVVENFDSPGRFSIQTLKRLSDEGDRARRVQEMESRVVFGDTSTYFVIENSFFDLAPKTSSPQEVVNDLSVEEVFLQLGAVLEQEEGDNSHTSSFSVTHMVSLHKLMEGNLPLRYFERFLVLDPGGVVLYPGLMMGIPFFDPDQVKMGDSSDSGAYQAEELLFKVKLGNVDYEAFMSPLTLAGTQLYLLGLKEQIQFQRAVSRIDFALLSVLLLGLIVVFTGIPIIGIFSLSEGDVLTKGKVVGIGVSLLFLALVVGYAFAFVQNRNTSAFDGRLVNATAEQISEQFETRLRLFQEYIKKGSSDSLSAPDRDNLRINEYIAFSPDGNIQKLGIPGREELNLGDQSFIRLAGRDYVTESQKNPGTFYISSHFSKGTGALEGVFSLFHENKGWAITFSLEGFVDKEIDENRFFVFRPDGRVLTKSAGISLPVNNLQNAIDAGAWRELEALLANNQHDQHTVWEMPLYVSGQSYQAVLRQIEVNSLDTPIWLLYLVDVSLVDSLFILATFETLAFLIPYFLFLGMVIASAFLARKTAIYLRIREFVLDWYRPAPSRRDRFLFANYILAFHLFIFLAVYVFVPLNVFSALSWATTISVGAMICNFLLLFPEGNRGLSSREFNFLAPSILIWATSATALVTLVLASMSGAAWCFSLITFGLLCAQLVLSFVAAHRGWTPNLRPELAPEGRGWRRIHYRFTRMWNFVTQLQVEKRIFSLNFLLWILLLGFLPGYVIHRQVFLQERFIWQWSSGERMPDEYGEPPKGIYAELISIHEQLRRENFSKLTNRQDPELMRFLSPNIQAVGQSFVGPKEVLIKATPREDMSLFTHFFFHKIGRSPVLALFALLVFGLFFNLIMRISKRVFMVDYLFATPAKPLPADCLSRRFTFIVGLDNQKIRQWIHFQFLNRGEELTIVSALQSDALPEKVQAVLLEDLHMLESCSSVLEVLERFSLQYFSAEVPIFISSGKSLQEILNEDTTQSVQARITEIIKPFLFFTVPLDFHQQIYLLPYSGGSKSNRENRQESLHLAGHLAGDPFVVELTHELVYGENQAALACLVTQELEEEYVERSLSQERYEKCLLLIQRYQKAYFINIWSKLDMRERKVCYYFALEGFLKFTNRDVVASLLQKGVIRLNSTRDRLNLFSTAFANFILSRRDQAEVLAFEKDEKTSGNVRVVQAAAVSFVFISVAVIGFYDPNILDKSAAYVTGAIGLLGTLYGIFQNGIRSFWKAEE